MDITAFASDAARATFLADAVGNPEGALFDVMDGVESYLSANDTDKLPESVCGPVTGLLSALMVGTLVEMFDPVTGALSPEANPLDIVQKVAIASDTIQHAVAHGDALGQAIASGGSLDDSYDAIVEWVTARLWEESDADPDLILSLAGFDDDDAA